MDVKGFTVKITPQCVEGHGAKNRVNYAFQLLRDRITRSIKAYPDKDIEVTYTIKDV